MLSDTDCWGIKAAGDLRQKVPCHTDVVARLARA